MKNKKSHAIKFLTLTTFLCLLLACNKAPIEQVEPVVSKKPTLEVDNGVLVFPDFLTFQRILDSVNQIPDNQKDAWEKSLGFTSARRNYNEVSDRLSEATTEAQFKTLLNTYGDDLILEGDELKTVTGNNYFNPVVNAKGIVRVGKDYYRFYKGMETIVLNGSVDKVIAASKSGISDKEAGIIQYSLMEDKTNAKVLGGQTCDNVTLSECLAQTSTRKSFHKLEFSRYIGVLTDPNTYLPTAWIQRATVQLHFSAQKKVLFTWNSYATTYKCNTLDYEDNDNKSVHLVDLFSNGDYNEWYYQLNFRNWQTPYSEPMPAYCSPYIYSFQCNATSRGTDPVSCTFTY